MVGVVYFTSLFTLTEYNGVIYMLLFLDDDSLVSLYAETLKRQLTAY